MRRRHQAEHEGVTEDQLVHDEATEQYLADPESRGHIFMDRPFVTYTGHTSDLLDVSWSKNFFILTSSMDKTVRLWHISMNDCLTTPPREALADLKPHVTSVGILCRQRVRRDTRLRVCPFVFFLPARFCARRPPGRLLRPRQ